MRRYIPGDTVKMSVGVQHKMHLEEVFAIFVHEEKDQATFVVGGVPKLAEEQWAVSQDIIRSKADLKLRLPS